MEIDGSFLVWDKENQQIRQRWRDGATLNFNDRLVPFIGGDATDLGFGDNVEIITHENTRYVYLFDVDNQTFTVYDTVGLKTNDAYGTSYSLKYVMKFMFDIPAPIVDMAITSSSGNRTVLYILTSEGLYQIKVFEFVEEIKADEAEALAN